MRREDDFLLRMIQELAAVITYALGLSRAQKYDMAHDVLDQAAGDLIGLNINSLVQLGEDGIVAALQLRERATWHAKTAVLAWLLLEDGGMYAEEGEEEIAYGRYLTALHLRLALAAENWDPGEDIPTVSQLVAKLDAFVLPAGTYLRLVQTYEAGGEFDQAENVLFTWLESAETAVVAGGEQDLVDPVAAGIAFYQRLQQLSNENLIAGNLPRAEVEAGLAELLDLA